MAEFQLRFFGGLSLMLGEQDLTRALSVKAQGLICFLACDTRPQTRAKLAGMFWTDKPESDALRSLRVDLTKIRKHIAPYIEATRLNLTFVDNGTHWLDTQTFDHHLQLAQSADGPAARNYLREAVQLYTGDFLEGYLPGDALGFEEWLMVEQENYRSRALIALEKLLALDVEHQDYEAGIASANQILRIDPWREEAHRSLMWLYMQNGQRSAALRQYDQCRTVLETELGVDPEPQTVELWQKIKEQASDPIVATQPLNLPQTSEAETPFQTPPQIKFFSGRDDDLSSLKAQIETGNGVQVFCVTGMGGVGKTSFVVEFAHQNRDYFADGVLWASAANNPETIAEKWAVAYGYDFRGVPRIEDRLRAVRGMLAEKQALIVVDGMEVAARVKPLIPTEGESVVLVTTRNADLAYALDASLFDLNELTVENGRFLLSNILGFARVEKEQAAADGICRRLQNLPLALAIAGQYLVKRPRRRLEDFLQRLSEYPLMAEADSTGAVRASFDISWTALDQKQKQVFALLAVFEGRAFSAAAMAHIANLNFYEMQDHLDTLATRSLLIEEGREYYRQHALLSHFADEKLGDKRAPSLRMVDYYSGFTDEYNANYKKLSEEWDNLDASIQVMADESLWQTLFRVNQNLNQAWFAQGLFEKAFLAHRLAYEGAIVLEEDSIIGEHLFWQGMAVLEQGDNDRARRFFEQALKIFEEANDPISVSDIQYELARIYIEQAYYERAEQVLSHSLQVKQTLNDRQGIAQIKYRQSRLHFRMADPYLAAELASEAVSIQEDFDEPLDLIRTLRLLVWIYCEIEEFPQAKECGEQALRLAREINNRGEIAMSLYGLAEVARRLKNYDEGLSLGREGLRLVEQMGDIHSQGVILYRIALLFRDQKNFEETIEFAKKAVVFSEKSGDRLMMAWALANIGMAYDNQGEMGEAKKYIIQSRDIGKEVGNDAWVTYIDDYLESR